MLGWLITCRGAVVVVVVAPTGAGTGGVVAGGAVAEVVVDGAVVVVVVGGLVVVVVVDGRGATVVVVAAPATATTVRSGAAAMAAVAARATFLRSVSLSPIGTSLNRPAEPKTVPTNASNVGDRGQDHPIRAGARLSR